jgi:hypothetical protein
MTLSRQDFIKRGGKGSDGLLTRGEVTRKTITTHGQTLDKVLVSETRCCRQRGGQSQKIAVSCTRLSRFETLSRTVVSRDFVEDGCLKSPTVCNIDTPIQRKVKKPKLTRMEIVALILYTSTHSY